MSFRSLVDAVYALKDEVHELKKVLMITYFFYINATQNQFVVKDNS